MGNKRLPLLGIVFLCYTLAYSFSDDYNISFLSVENGLSHNEVTSITQDHNGFMWFGTRGGLNRYDGYDFKHFKPSVSDSNSISSPSIESLYFNTEDEVLIGLKSGGPAKFITCHQRFRNLEIAKKYGHNRVLSFFEDSKGNTWIGSWKNGVLCMNNDTVIHYHDGGQIRDIVETNDGQIWVASTTGLKMVNQDEGRLVRFKRGSFTSISLDVKNECFWALGWMQDLMKVEYKTSKVTEFKNNANETAQNYTVYNDASGRLWVGTWGDGLFLFDKANEHFTKLDVYHSQALAAPVDYNVVRVIYEDNVGNIWLGTQAGIVRLSATNNFKSVSIHSEEQAMHTHVTAVCQVNGITWLGTNGNGLFYSDDDVTFHPVYSDEIQKKGAVRAINKGPDNKLWVSFESGIYVVDEDDKGNYYLTSANRYFVDDDIKHIRKAHQLFFDDEQLWVATQQKGVLLYKKSASKYYFDKHFMAGETKGMLGDNRVTAIQKDVNGRLWFATYKGLFQFSVADSSFLSMDDLGVKSRLACDIVLCLQADEQGNLWFGTPCSLNQLVMSDEAPRLTTFTKNNGLADDYINGLVIDDKGKVWCSGNAGISSLNPKNGQVLNFDKADGIGDLSYSEGAFCKGNDGSVYFGGYTALTHFHPDNIASNAYQPPLVISRFTILNKEVEVGDKSGILQSNINETNELVLSHHEMEFSFQVASLDFKAPGKNQYAYRFMGDDDEWIELGNQREISFSNLKPGTYHLQIRGTNSNGIWSNSIKELAIVIKPAPWKSVYAIVAYVVLIMLVVWVIIHTVVRQERLQNTVELERLQNNQIKELNDYKLRFFTNISHEFRTPLTLILAPVKELLSKDFSELKSGFYQERIQMIGHNTNRLYNLVNQLLEFRKMESGKILLNVSEANLQKLIDDTVLPFKQLAKTQALRFSVNYRANDTSVFVDVERISVVLTNLLSNAFKHVVAKGRVQINVTDDSDSYNIAISNDGKVIPQAEIQHLFERFYQVKGNSSIGSSGIGLQLVKTFTELHKGEVTVESVEGSMVTFTVQLKKGSGHFSGEEMQHEPSQEITRIVTESPATKASVNTGTKGAAVLIVEDNVEVRLYLQQLLSDYYSVLVAEDGLEGFDKAIEHQPALVLSDVMMPRMDGYELCEKIKTNDLLLDIPVVLLTAKGSDREHLFGSQKGADAYIKKPFNPELLLEEIKQLIATRQQLKQKYANKVVLEAKQEEISSADARFLKESVKIVEKHLNNASFTPDDLAGELAMSSSSFYRKIKKSTNFTPAGFIRSIRLKKAAHLLKESDLTVSEIIERVGYLDSRSFRKNFKEQYNETPSDYRKMND